MSNCNPLSNKNYVQFYVPLALSSLLQLIIKNHQNHHLMAELPTFSFFSFLLYFQFIVTYCMKDIIPSASQLPIIKKKKSCPDLFKTWLEKLGCHFLPFPLRAGQLNFTLAFNGKGSKCCLS